MRELMPFLEYMFVNKLAGPDEVWAFPEHTTAYIISYVPKAAELRLKNVSNLFTDVLSTLKILQSLELTAHGLGKDLRPLRTAPIVNQMEIAKVLFPLFSVI